MIRTLLLNSNYEPISFITEKKLFVFLYKEKIDIIESWDDVVKVGLGKIRFPAIVRLKYGFKRYRPVKIAFTRNAIIKRDNSQCQFCSMLLIPSQITMDHVIPKSLGGRNSFENCVVACMPCNNKKKNRTPEQAGMKLLKTPVTPSYNLYILNKIPEEKFPGWKNYI
jgi:hypothetical protein